MAQPSVGNRSTTPTITAKPKARPNSIHLERFGLIAPLLVRRLTRFSKRHSPFRLGGACQGFPGRAGAGPPANGYSTKGLLAPLPALLSFRISPIRTISSRSLLTRSSPEPAIPSYFMLRDGVPYHDVGPDYFDRLNRANTIKRLVRKLEDLGCEVELKKAA